MKRHLINLPGVISMHTQNFSVFWQWFGPIVNWLPNWVVIAHLKVSYYFIPCPSLTTDAPQPWTYSRDCYFEYLIIHFD